MNGVDIYTMPAGRLLPVLYAGVIDNLVTLGVSRQEVRDELGKRIQEATLIYNARKMRPSTKPEPSTSTEVVKQEAAPFVLTPQMAQALGLNRNRPVVTVEEVNDT